MTYWARFSPQAVAGIPNDVGNEVAPNADMIIFTPFLWYSLRRLVLISLPVVPNLLFETSKKRSGLSHTAAASTALDVPSWFGIQKANRMVLYPLGLVAPISAATASPHHCWSVLT